MAATHTYRARVRWTGNLGSGTTEYTGYSRDHLIQVEGKPDLLSTSGLSPRSDPSRHNPEDLLVASLSSCHMLWYLHLCSREGVVVESYEDDAEGVLETAPDGSGRFRSVVLRPRVRLSAGSEATARRLHEEAHQKCFVANSVNFPVTCEPIVERASAA